MKMMRLIGKLVCFAIISVGLICFTHIDQMIFFAWNVKLFGNIPSVTIAITLGIVLSLIGYGVIGLRWLDQNVK